MQFVSKRISWLQAGSTLVLMNAALRDTLPFIFDDFVINPSKDGCDGLIPV
jgi:hypothetical protein